ncbi:MAG: FGGY family carbohydrate kinase, partial [Syntrophobacteria bacterium]
QAAIMATREAVSRLKDEPRLRAIGLCGQMHGTVLLGIGNQLLQPAIIWPDQRSTHQVKEIIELVGKDRLLRITGSMAATGFQSATLRWMQQDQEQEQVWSMTRKVLLPKDYLRWLMCGEFATDPSDAAGTGFLDGGHRTWSQEILTELQVDIDLLPPIKSSIHLSGILRSDAAQEFGLPVGTPVVVGAADTAASLLGAGVTLAGDLLLTISTGGQLIMPSSRFVADRQGRLHSFCSALEPDQHQAGWYMMGATLSAGQSLHWLRDNVLKIANREGYTQMIAWAAQAPIGSDGLIFAPYLAGDRAADDDLQVRGAFIGLTIRHGKAELVRAVLEGVVFSLYEKYLMLVENTATPERIILAGGGARSTLWTQIVADVFGLPVQRLIVEEQSAFGAALLAGAGIGLFDAAEGARDWEKFADKLEPDMKAHARYQDLLPSFQEISQKTRSLP